MWYDTQNQARGHFEGGSIIFCWTYRETKCYGCNVQFPIADRKLFESGNPDQYFEGCKRMNSAYGFSVVRAMLNKSWVKDMVVLKNPMRSL